MSASFALRKADLGHRARISRNSAGDLLRADRRFRAFCRRARDRNFIGRHADQTRRGSRRIDRLRYGRSGRGFRRLKNPGAALCRAAAGSARDRRALAVPLRAQYPCLGDIDIDDYRGVDYRYGFGGDSKEDN